MNLFIVLCQLKKNILLELPPPVGQARCIEYYRTRAVYSYSYTPVVKVLLEGLHTFNDWFLF